METTRMLNLKGRGKIIIIALVVILLSTVLFQVATEKRYISALEEINAANEIAIGWRDDAKLFSVVSALTDMKGGKCTAWSYMYFSPSSEVMRNNVSEYDTLWVIIYGSGNTEVKEWDYPRPASAIDVAMDSTVAYEIAFEDPDMRSFYQNYPDSDIHLVYSGYGPSNYLFGWKVYLIRDYGFDIGANEATTLINGTTGHIDQLVINDNGKGDFPVLSNVFFILLILSSLVIGFMFFMHWKASAEIGTSAMVKLKLLFIILIFISFNCVAASYAFYPPLLNYSYRYLLQNIIFLNLLGILAIDLVRVRREEKDGVPQHFISPKWRKFIEMIHDNLKAARFTTSAIIAGLLYHCYFLFFIDTRLVDNYFLHLPFMFSETELMIDINYYFSWTLIFLCMLGYIMLEFYFSRKSKRIIYSRLRMFGVIILYTGIFWLMAIARSMA